MSSRLQDHKSKLKKESDQYEESLNEEFTEFSKAAGSVATKAAVIGGSALVAYLIVKSIVGSGKKERDNDEEKQVVVKSGPNPKTLFLKSLSDKAALIVLELAREMILNIIKNLPEKNDQKDT